jgi:membrane-associated phospholipid phosphatase
MIGNIIEKKKFIKNRISVSKNSINHLIALTKLNGYSFLFFYSSWPGEHTAVNLIWALFMSTIISRSSRSLSSTKRFLMYTIIWFLAILFSIARLVSGAHWLSDCLAGGLSEALIIVAIGIYTPVFQFITKTIHWLLNRSKSNEKLP